MKHTHRFAAGLLSLAVFATACDKGTELVEKTPEVNEVTMMQHITKLSSDAFLGRKPFTAGDTLTVNYLSEAMEKTGLEPGNGDSYVQEVPMVEITGSPDEVMTLSGKEGQSLSLNYVSDFVASTSHEQEEVQISNSELVFAGYGVVAPEYKWNDYEGLDVAGKTVLVLVNDPGFVSDDSTFFKGHAMTYYGRYTYKYEEAARQGATGVIVIHDTKPAGYPWGVIETSFTGAHLNLQTEDKGSEKCALEGWITTDGVRKVMETAGQDYDAALAAAAKPGFTAIPLGLSYDYTIKNQLRYANSNNVIGMVKGQSKPDEYIVYSAHWDHLGVGSGPGDSIYNGAMDNASGVAALLAIGEAFAEAKPERSVLFLAVTGEEQGLLGSAWYASHPTVPAKQLVANINMDALSPFGPMKDFQVIGYGQSDMDDIARTHVEAQGRYILPDQAPEKGYFFRSDHFNFAKIGVPALYGKGGFEHAEKGKEYVAQMEEQYRSKCYHQPCDEIDPAFWDFAGMRLDAQLLFEIGLDVASMEGQPQWKEGSEFKKKR